MHALGSSTIAEVTIGKYVESFDSVRLVVRDHDDAFSRLVARFDIEIVHAKQAHLGMGHSLACGFDGLPWDWGFVALLDMPFIKTSTLLELKSAALDLADSKQTAISIIRPITTHDPAYGHPVGWARTHFTALSKTTGDEGARHLLQTQDKQILSLTVDDPGILQDIDAPEDVH